MRVIVNDAPRANLTGPMLDAALRVSGIPLIIWDLEGKVLAANDSFCDLLGYERERLSSLRRVDLFHPDDRPATERRMAARREGNEGIETYAGRIWTANKRILRVACRSTAVVSNGEVVGDAVTCDPRDASLGDDLDRQAEQYLALFTRISDAVYVLDDRGVVSWMNPSAVRLFGRTTEVLRRTPRNEVLFPEAERGQDTLRQQFSSGDTVPDEIQFRIKRPDGEARWVRGSLLMLRDRQGKHTRSIVIARDVTEDRRRARELREQAERSELEAKVDSLTGLGNRRAFDEAAVMAQAAAAGGADMSLIVMDMDRLKAVNDTLGHASGDDALRAVAEALTSRTRSNDEVFRIGGDEFAVIASGGDPALLAERLRAPIRFREPEPWISVSVGPARWSEDIDPYTLADQRMYAMKRSQRDAPARPEESTRG